MFIRALPLRVESSVVGVGIYGYVVLIPMSLGKVLKHIYIYIYIYITTHWVSIYSHSIQSFSYLRNFIIIMDQSK
jgi:hypothetical protein